MGISTGAGDTGTTELAGGERVPKDHPRIEALGALDELNAFLGDVRTLAKPETAAILRQIQGELMRLSGILAAPTPLPGDRPDHRAISSSDCIPVCAPGAEPGIDRLDGWIGELEALLRESPLRGFVLPGENPAEAKLHLARTVCRRAERRLVSLNRQEGVPAPFLVYLNRLSDLLFLLACGES